MCDVIIAVTHHLRCQPPLSTFKTQPPHPRCRPVGLCGHTTWQGDQRGMMRHNLNKVVAQPVSGQQLQHAKDKGMWWGPLLCPSLKWCVFSSSITFLNINHSYSIHIYARFRLYVGGHQMARSTIYWQWAVLKRFSVKSTLKAKDCARFRWGW